MRTHLGGYLEHNKKSITKHVKRIIPISVLFTITITGYQTCQFYLSNNLPLPSSPTRDTPST